MKGFNQIAILLAGVSIFMGSCSGEKAEQREIHQKEKPVVEWVRPAQKGGTSAAYFSYSNNLSRADTLISISSPAAGMAQVHESYETEDGMMGMRERQNLVIGSGETITFTQGGQHIMLMQLNEQIEAGDSVVIELELKQRGVVKKKIPVTSQ